MAAAIDVDLRGLTKALSRVQRAGLDLRPAWKQLRGPLRRDQAQHIRDQRDEQDRPWTPLAASTVAKRRKALLSNPKAFTKKGRVRKPIQRRLDRVLSGRLTSGARVKMVPQHIAITSRVPWAGIHQVGGRAGRNSIIPARTFMYIGSDLAATAGHVITQHLIAAFANTKL